jgi:hypothetical protein
MDDLDIHCQGDDDGVHNEAYTTDSVLDSHNQSDDVSFFYKIGR